MYSAVELSKYIVTKCIRDGHPISNLQLQKILYYVQKAYLDINSRAFFDEIEAWQFGPVVPSAYYRFSGFGAMPITLSYSGVSINPSDQQIIDPIVVEKRSMNPWDMVEDTHKPNGAWSQVYRNGAGNRAVIPIELIKAVG
ncbi:MAG: Panacea domain-containing protein [Suilimivivens sp.]